MHFEQVSIPTTALALFGRKHMALIESHFFYESMICFYPVLCFEYIFLIFNSMLFSVFRLKVLGCIRWFYPTLCMQSLTLTNMVHTGATTVSCRARSSLVTVKLLSSPQINLVLFLPSGYESIIPRYELSSLIGQVFWLP